MKHITRFCSPAEKSIITVCVACMLITNTLRFINPINYKYASILNSYQVNIAGVALVLLALLASYVKSFMPFAGKVILIVMLTALPFTVGFSGEGPILLTPFHTIDSKLLYFDRLIGFNSIKLMNYTHSNPQLIKVLTWCYYSLLAQMACTPVVLTLFGHYNQAKRLTYAMIICSIASGIIYFLWPTTGPASVLHNQYFLQSSHQLVDRFQAIHSNRLPALSGGVGLIAFPSCHVIFATLITFMLRPIKYLFIPAIIVNSLLVVATIALGYHFLADIIAGFVIAFITLQITKAKHFNN